MHKRPNTLTEHKDAEQINEIDISSDGSPLPVQSQCHPQVSLKNISNISKSLVRNNPNDYPITQYGIMQLNSSPEPWAHSQDSYYC